MCGFIYIGLIIIFYNFCKIVEWVGIKVEYVVIVFLVLVKLVLNEGECEFGVIVIDMGGG